MKSKRKRSLLRRFLRKLAFYIVFVTFYIPTSFNRKMTDIPDTCDEESLLEAFEKKYERCYEEAEFREPETDLALRGIFLPGVEAARKEKCAVIFCHGLGGTKAQLMTVADFVHELGHDVLLFDMRGHGDSEGDFTSLGYFESCDTLAACAYMREKRGAKRIVLFGFSMGAVAAVLAGAQDDSVAAVVAESPYDSLENVVVHKAREHYHIPKWPIISLSLWATEVKRNFDRRDVDLTKSLPQLEGKHVLLAASTGDKTIPVEMTRRLTPHLKKGHEYWEVDGVDHGGIFESKYGQEYRKRLRKLLARCNDGCEKAKPRESASAASD